MFNATVLFVLLRRRRRYVPGPGWPMFLAKVVVAGGVLAAVLSAAVGPASAWLDATLAARVVRLALIVAGGATAYFAALALLGFRPRDFSRREGVPDEAPPPQDE